MMKLGIFLFLGAVLVAQQCYAYKEEWVLECSGGTPYKREEFEAENPSEKIKCYHDCLLQKAGVLDDTGKLDADKMVELTTGFSKTDAQKAFVKTMIPACVNQANAPNTSGKCERGYLLVACITKEEEAFLKNN